jgi:predicted lipid-binding transport protein (Tim44 family)
MKNWSARMTRRCVLALFALCEATASFGRAGGGGHGGGGGGGHSGGGFSGGGHSGGGGGGSIGGVITLIVIALIIWYIFRRIQQRGNSGTPPGSGPSSASREAMGAALGAAVLGALNASQGRRPGAPAAAEAVTATIASLRERDPNFEMESFLQRVEMTFYLVKRAIRNNDTNALRPFLNDALFAQISQSLAQAKAQHRHELLESLNVRAVHVMSAELGEQQQSMLVHFDLVYRGKTLDDANHVVADEGADTRHGEQWTFVRAAAAKTPVAGGVTASRCPACGAELRLNLDGSCMHCRASVTNGTVDWVVSSVQPAAFLGSGFDLVAGAAAPTVDAGLATLKAADANFALDTFCGRARAGFTALQDAWCKQNLDAGRNFLSPGAYFAWRSQLEAMASEGRRNVMENLQIQRILPTRVVHGQVFDDLTVRITASCADYEVDQSGRVVFGDRTARPFSEEWTFQRSVGVATSGKPGTLENTCPRCGAPLQLTAIGECRYCKAAVTSGKFDWVVSRIEQEDDEGGSGGDGPDIGSMIARQVGGAVIGGLLGSLLAGGSRRDDS